MRWLLPAALVLLLTSYPVGAADPTLGVYELSADSCYAQSQYLVGTALPGVEPAQPLHVETDNCKRQVDPQFQIVSYAALIAVNLYNPTEFNICPTVSGRAVADGVNRGVATSPVIYTMPHGPYYQKVKCIPPGKQYDARLVWDWPAGNLNPTVAITVWGQPEGLVIHSYGWVMGPGVAGQSPVGRHLVTLNIEGDIELWGFFRADSGLFPSTTQVQVRVSSPGKRLFAAPVTDADRNRGGLNNITWRDRVLASGGTAIYVSGGDPGDVVFASFISAVKAW